MSIEEVLRRKLGDDYDNIKRLRRRTAIAESHLKNAHNKLDHFGVPDDAVKDCVPMWSVSARIEVMRDLSMKS